MNLGNVIFKDGRNNKLSTYMTNFIFIQNVIVHVYWVHWGNLICVFTV